VIPFLVCSIALPSVPACCVITSAPLTVECTAAPSRYPVDELAEYMVAAGGGAQGADKDEQIDRLKSALQHEHVP